MAGRMVGVDAPQFNNPNATSNVTFSTTGGLLHITPSSASKKKENSY